MKPDEYQGIRKSRGAWNTTPDDYDRVENAIATRVDRFDNNNLLLSLVSLFVLLVHAVLLVGRELHAMRTEATARRGNPR